MEDKSMIKEVSLEHMNDIYQLICVLENTQLCRESFEKKFLMGINDPNVFYYVYEMNHCIVGFMSLYIHHYLHHNKATAEIVELVVSPEARGQKIGDQLIRYVEDLAKKMQLEEIELSTSTYRKRAHRFYEAHGFIMNHYNYIKKL